MKQENKQDSLKAQILRTLKGKHLKNKEFVGFDIETHGINNDFYMGGIYSQKYGYIAFYDKEEMIKWFLKEARKNRTLHVIATNLMFDFTGLFYTSKYWNDFQLVMKQGKMLMAKLKDVNRNYTLAFIDTLNYAQFPVAVMGDILNIPKLDQPKAIHNDNKGFARIPKNKEEKEELEIYNKRDCEITYKFMKFLQEGFKSFGGKTKLTASSTAMDIFRRQHLKKWIFKEDLVLKRQKENTIHKFIFEGYSGGRTETFKRGLVKGATKVYDINSMYSGAMLQNMPRPDSVKHTFSGKMFHLQYEGVSRVTIEAPELYYPLLPKRLYNKNGEIEKLIFPTGIFSGVYTHVELRKALELGYTIHKIHETLYYLRTFKPFKSYIDKIYAKKEEYDIQGSPMKSVAKILLNGLYGKFAEKKAEDTQIINPELMNREEYEKIKDKVRLTMSGFLTNTTKKEVYKPHVIPIWATYTTAYARLNLYEYLSKYKALYCDTDSCATKKEMPTSTKIGEMKLEYDVTNAIFVKPKMYMYDIVGGGVKIRMKGVSKMNKQKFMDILEGKKVYFDKFTKLKEAINRGIQPNAIQEVEKSISLEDEKRKWIQKFDPSTLEDSSPLKSKL